MLKVFVTGGAGFVGSNLVKALSDKGYVPKVFDDLSLGKMSNLEGDYIFQKGSITDFPTLKEAMEGYDVVVHLAALPRINPSIENPLQAHEANLTGTLNVLEAARLNGVKHVIYAGSSSIFGKTARMPMREDDPKNPGSPYAYQKLMSEGYCHLYGSLYGLKTTILRFFNVFGEKQPTTGSYAVVAGIFMDQKEHGLPLTIKGDGTQLRDFTYVGDICQGIISAIEGEALGTYHLGSGTQTSINELAECVDPGGTREFLTASKGDYPETLADITLAKRRLGYNVTTHIIDWVKEQKKNNPSSTLPKGAEVVYSNT